MPVWVPVWYVLIISVGTGIELISTRPVMARVKGGALGFNPTADPTGDGAAGPGRS